MGTIARGALAFLMASVLAAAPAAASMCTALCAGPHSHGEGRGDAHATGDAAGVHDGHDTSHGATHHDAAMHHHAATAVPSSDVSAVSSMDAALIAGKVPFCCDVVGTLARAFGNVRPSASAPLMTNAPLLQASLPRLTTSGSRGALRRGPPGTDVPLLPAALRTTILRI